MVQKLKPIKLMQLQEYSLEECFKYAWGSGVGNRYLGMVTHLLWNRSGRGRQDISDALDIIIGEEAKTR
jgi:hypothetical protein